MVDATTKRNKKVFKGVVVSDAMDKTVVVAVDRFVKHPKYKKFYTKTKKFHVHDEKNFYKKGDKIEIMESKPYSKTKAFEVIYKE